MTLTQRNIESLKPNGKDLVYWDHEVRGLGLRIKPSGSKSFLIQYRYQGRSKRLTIGSATVWPLKEARKRAQELLRLVDLGLDPQAETEKRSPTVEQLCLEYLDKAEQGLILGRKGTPKKPSTLATDRGRVARHIIPLLGAKLITDVTPADARAFLEAVTLGKTKADVKTKLRGRAIVKGGSGTASRTLGLLGGIFTYAVERGYLASHPIRGIRRPKDNKRRQRLTPPDYAALSVTLAAHKRSWQFVYAVKLIALTGLRRGEALKLKWSEVDLYRQTLFFGDTKTGESLRPLGKAAVELLKEIQAFGCQSEYVFPAVRSATGPYKGFSSAWTKLKLPYTAHTLRHSFASLANDLGYTPFTIAAFLGHASQGVTADYVHHIDRSLIACADRVSNLVGNWLRGNHSLFDGSLAQRQTDLSQRSKGDTHENPIDALVD